MRSVRYVVLLTLLGSTGVGAVLWKSTGEWRWAVTGLLVALMLFALGGGVVAFLDTGDPDVGPGFVFVLVVLFCLGPLAALMLWTWTGHAEWALGLLLPLLGLIAFGTLAGN
jgi:hypothetical protein